VERWVGKTSSVSLKWREKAKFRSEILSEVAETGSATTQILMRVEILNDLNEVPRLETSCLSFLGYLTEVSCFRIQKKHESPAVFFPLGLWVPTPKSAGSGDHSTFRG